MFDINKINEIRNKYKKKILIDINKNNFLNSKQFIKLLKEKYLKNGKLTNPFNNIQMDLDNNENILSYILQNTESYILTYFIYLLKDINNNIVLEEYDSILLKININEKENIINIINNSLNIINNNLNYKMKISIKTGKNYNL